MNQQSSTCVGCNQTLHFKCLREDPKTESNCLKCYSCLQLRNQVNEQNTESNGGLMADACFQEFHSYVKARGLIIFHQNVCGLLRVLDQVKILLHEVKEIDIFGLSECHFDAKIGDEELRIPGYNLHRFDRKNGPEGGVAVYVRDHLDFRKRPDLEIKGIECCWIELPIKKSKSLLVESSIVHRIPQNT